MNESAADKHFRHLIQTELAAAKEARSCLPKCDVVYFGKTPHTAGMLMMNYANMILNRMTDLFDDVVFLMDNDRLASACVISRCVLETYAVGLLALDKLQALLEKRDLDEAAKIILRFINSSRIKVNEQKDLKRGKFKIDDFHFTEEARYRMLTEGAASIHVLDAMRLLFQLELSHTQASQSVIEMIYDGLCEATHPSQTSLLHAYASNMPMTETSQGLLSRKASQTYTCVMGLQHIKQVKNVHTSLFEVGEAFHKLENDQRT